jgi:hypothetical protein
MSGRWVKTELGRQRFIRDRAPEPTVARSDLPMPFVVGDLPAYASPLGDGIIDGRAARREHFKRTNTREVDPGEWKERSAQFKAEKAEKQAIADAWKAGKDVKRGTA